MGTVTVHPVLAIAFGLVAAACSQRAEIPLTAILDRGSVTLEGRIMRQLGLKGEEVMKCLKRPD